MTIRIWLEGNWIKPVISYQGNFAAYMMERNETPIDE